MDNINEQQKKRERGRPPTGAGVSIHVRLPPAEIDALDQWIAEQKKPGSRHMTRPEAVRHLVKLALAGK